MITYTREQVTRQKKPLLEQPTIKLFALIRLTPPKLKPKKCSRRQNAESSAVKATGPLTSRASRAQHTLFLHGEHKKGERKERHCRRQQRSSSSFQVCIRLSLERSRTAMRRSGTRLRRPQHIWNKCPSSTAPGAVADRASVSAKRKRSTRCRKTRGTPFRGT